MSDTGNTGASASDQHDQPRGPEESAWQAYVTAEVINAGAVVTLDRPKALNALNEDMQRQIAAAMPGFTRDPEVYALIMRSTSPRAFCAGGDVRELSACAKANLAAAQAKLAAEYELNWNLECFSKPTVSLIDGMVMGSGVGLSSYGTHRVGGEAYSFAMPETQIGFFPDVGAASVLARLPHNIGLYLGLSGLPIGRADGFHLGLLTHCVAASEFDAITAALCDADPVDPVLDERHQDPGPSTLLAIGPVIERCFGGAGVEQIIDNLRAVDAGTGTGAGTDAVAKDWAKGALAQMESASPLSLKVTLRHIRAAREQDLRQVLVTDYRLGCRFLGAEDFHEGVRAALIDKDKAPNWKLGSLQDVSTDLVDSYFSPLEAGDLVLKSRRDMQALR